jgi:8-oxo-dGTP diphosphatase
MIHVSAAIIHNDKGEVLICQRGPGGNCEFLWEFPGGKQEPDETSEDCLLRECREELNVEIGIDDLFAETAYAYPDREIAFAFFDAHIVSGTPKMDVHNDMKWILPEDMSKYDLCPADITVIKKLQKC